MPKSVAGFPSPASSRNRTALLPSRFSQHYTDSDRRCNSADIGQSGGEPGADGAADNNDFVVFINQFFTPCS